MPTIIPHLQKVFKLKLQDGVPTGLVEETPNGDMLLCCPLCGCSHQVTNASGATVYEPLCQSMPTMFKEQRISWVKRFPEIKGFNTLVLVRSVG